MNLRSALAVATLLLSGCGTTQSIGNDPLNGEDGGTLAVTCSGTQSCPQDFACDHDNVCRHWCGSNYPGFVCPTGTTCDRERCRPVCTGAPGECAAGTTCQSGICKPPACDELTPCEARHACVEGNCQPIGFLCPNGTGCHPGEDCQAGTCRVRCGALYPTNFCATGHTCQNGACQP